MGEIDDKIKNDDRLFKKFKKSKLHIDKGIYNAAQNINYRKWLLRAFFENKLTESIGKSKDLWKALRSLGLPSKTSSCEFNASKVKNTVEHDVNSVLESFRKYYSTLAESLTKMLPKPTNKYSINTVIRYDPRGLFSFGIGFEKLSSNYFKSNSICKSSWY